VPRCAEAACGRWRPFERGIVRAGLQLNGRWYCSRACVETAARSGLDDMATGRPVESESPFALGVLLRHFGEITDGQLHEALASQGASGLRLGEQLVALGWATRDSILRALAVQASVRYLTNFDTSMVRPEAAVLPAAMVRALGLVPFDVDPATRRLSVACSAPVPRKSLRALAALTDWIPEPFLVQERPWREALETYRPQTAGEGSDAVTVAGLGAAAAHVANAAVRTRAVTMRHAPCDPYVWVRVEGAAQVSDLLVHD
jgi:hypothetical protein